VILVGWSWVAELASVGLASPDMKEPPVILAGL